jgi:hypothetical protein
VLDEQAIRAGTFDAEISVPVTFAGGQVLSVQRPRIMIRPQFSGGRAIAARAELDDEEVATLLAAVRAAHERGEPPEPHPGQSADPATEAKRQSVLDDAHEAWLIACSSLAACLLGRNYSLADDVLGELLTVGPRTDWLKRVPRIARGME